MPARRLVSSVAFASLSVALAACGSAPPEAEGTESASALTRAYCPTTTLAQGAGVIHVDGTSTFIGRVDGAILTCPSSSDCSAPTTLASGSYTVWDMAIDASSVYWTTADSILKCAKTGCGGNPTVLAANQTYASRIAVDATNVYWIDFVPTPRILRCAVGGCNGAPTALATGLYNPEHIVSDGAFVYFDSGNQILRCAIGGCNGAPTLFASSGAGTTIEALAVDAHNLYFTTVDPTDTNGIVAKVPLSGGAPTTLATGQTVPSSIASDGRAVYWTQAGLLTSNGTIAPPGGSVMTCAISGCLTPTKLLVGDYGSPGGIAVDATSVYFEDASGGFEQLPKTFCYAPPPCGTTCQ